MSQQAPFGLRSGLFEDMSHDAQIAERERVVMQLDTEKLWMHDAGLTPYEHKAAVIGAITSGELVEVAGQPTLPYRQYLQRQASLQAIRQLPEDEVTVPYLVPRARHVLEEVAGFASEELNDDREVRRFMRLHGLATLQYCVTSMTRTLRYQSALLRRGALATPTKSTHTYGHAFDLDHSGYYVTRKDDPENQAVPVNDRHNPGLFFDTPVHIMHNALEMHRRKGDLTFVTELPQGRGCWHVAVKPQIIVDRQRHSPFFDAV